VPGRAGPCIYVNTSIVIRALNPKEPGHHEARRLLEECCKRCKCFWSTIHDLERMTPIQRLEFEGYLEGLGARKSHIDARRILARAEAYRLSIGAAESKLVDIMHMLAASLLGCRCILAVDRFIRARSGDFNLEYTNYYTGCGLCCPPESGAEAGTRQAYSSASSSRQATPTGPGRSTNSGQTQRSHTKRPRRGSRGSPGRPKRRRRTRRGGDEPW